MRQCKMTLTALAALALLASAPVAAFAACGDINKNGTVDVADALALAGKVAAASDCGTDKATCDVRKDNAIDIQDLNNLVAQLAGIKTLFDACTGPGPEVDCTGGATDPDTGLPIYQVPGQTISTNQTWPRKCLIQITGTVFISTPDAVNGPHTVITMEPGLIVKGKGSGSADPATLIFLTGSKIDAQGTAAMPIVMTSGQPTGSRDVGDWGGLALNGRSTVNRPGCINTAEGVPAPYGGCDASDSSGIMTYTRVEFSGIEFTPNNELNVITLNGVGNGTVLNHIQANSGYDDAIEWFGGTVNVKYFVSSASGDDGFDWQLGTTGNRQYGFMIQYGPHLQSGNQSRGIEADNSEFGFDDLPRSNPKFCNATWIGARDNDPNLGSEGGLFFRRGTAGGIANAIVTNFRDGCIKLNDAGTAPMACTNSSTLNPTEPNLLVQSTLCFDNGGTGAFGTATRMCAGVNSGSVCTASQWYNLLNTSKNVTPANGTCSVTTSQRCCQNSDCPTGQTCNGLTAGTNPYASTPWFGNGSAGATRWAQFLASGGGGGYPAVVPDPVPLTGDAVNFPSAADCSKIDPYFDQTNYIGAFQPGGTNWLDTPLRTDSPRAGVTTSSWPTSFRRWISFDIH